MYEPITITENGTDKLCFFSGTALDGNELFCYDGSSVRQRTNIRGIPANFGPSASPEELTFYNGAFYFQVTDSDYNEGLWQYDGTSTTKVAQINSDGDSSPTNLTVYNDALYFQADGGSDGAELWQYDGTEVRQEADINSGSRDSDPKELTVYDGTLYFQADGGSDGTELWKYNGGSASQVADINSGSNDSSPKELTVYDGTLYFQADDGNDGPELWKYDGSSVSQVEDIRSGSAGSLPTELAAYNGVLYFQADGGNDGAELWHYDGSSVSQVQDLYTGSCETVGGTEPCSSVPSELTIYKNTLYFNATNSGVFGGVLSYDGSNLALSPFENNAQNIGPEEKVVYNGKIYFTMDTDTTGTELWSYDGSSISHAADISDPKYLTVYDGTLYFQANGGNDGEELWSYDGTSATQVANIWDTTLNNSSSPKYLTVYDDELYFEAKKGDTKPLWSYDGSSVQKAADIGGELAVYDGSLYVGYGALYRFDGSSLTQVNSTELNPVEDLTVYDGSLYFRAQTDSDGEELWKYDGSSVSQVEDINEGSSDSSPADLTVAEGALYFRATGGSDGEELWRYDGSSVNQIQDINPGTNSSTPTDLTAFGNKLYFVANNGSDGWEPHAYTGGEYVNSLDFAPGGVSAGGFNPVVYDDGSGTKLYVTATNGISGFEFYAIGPDDPLPVELADFEATLNTGEIHLSWTTASETNNAGFHVQRRSTDGSGDWKTVGHKEGAGTTTEAQSYRFRDTDLPYEADDLTYRLKQVDTGGSAHLSKTVTIERSVDEIELQGTSPNPASQRTTVRYALPEKQKATIRLYDMLGRRVRTVLNGTREGRHEQRVDLSNLSSGVYFLRLQASGTVRTQKMTVVR